MSFNVFIEHRLWKNTNFRTNQNNKNSRTKFKRSANCGQKGFRSPYDGDSKFGGSLTGRGVEHLKFKFCVFAASEAMAEEASCNNGISSEAGTETHCWPALNFYIPPQRLYHFHHQFKHPSNCNNFLKGVKWSPDGSCFLTSSDDNTLRVFDLPDYGDRGTTNGDLSCSEDGASTSADSFISTVVVDGGESVYDYCWYPHMLASDPATCVFAATTRDHPVHLWDAVSGQLRCTYRAYDSMDEIAAAFSVAFSPTGTKLFCGYNKTLRAFDIQRPGRDFEQYSTLTSTKDGQTGIISCLAFSPGYTGLFAAGSYNRTTALYAEENAELLYVLHGQEGGVTQVLFSRDGNYLYTGGRKDQYILCWDVRNTNGIVYKLYRSVENTNQRIGFDIEPYGRHLGTGGQDGQVHIYDLQTGGWVTSYQVSFDTVNGFCFHPYLPLAVTSSGHRRFNIPGDEEENLSLKVEENCASVWNFSCTWVWGHVEDGKCQVDSSIDVRVEGENNNAKSMKTKDDVNNSLDDENNSPNFQNTTQH